MVDKLLFGNRLAYVAAVLGVIFAIVVFAQLRHYEHRQAQHAFSQDAQRFAAHVQQQVDGVNNDIAALRVALELEPQMSAAQFADISQHLLDNHRALFTLEWAPVVLAEERASYENAMGRAIYERDTEGYHRPAETRPYYVPVTYAYPLEPNREAITFDLASNPTRHQALRTAARADQVTYTDPIQLVQDPESTAVLALAPVNDTITRSPAAGLPRGYVAAIVRIAPFIQHATASLYGEQLGLTLHTASGAKLFDTPGAQSCATEVDTRAGTFSHQHTIQAGLGHWSLCISGNESQWLPRVHMPWIVLLVLLFATALVVMLVLVWGKTHHHAQSMAERSAELDQQVEELATRLQLATESARIGVWDWDVVHNELLWDDRMYELYGVREEEFGGAYEAWQQGVHPEDLEQANQDVQDALAGTKDFHTSFRIIHPNGEIRHIEAHGIVLRDSNGEPQRMIGMNWDITKSIQSQEASEARATALAQHEQQLREILETVNDGYWDWKLQEDYEYMSPGFWRMFGYDHTTKKHHPSEWQDMIHPDDLQVALDNFAKHAESRGEYPYNQFVRYQHRDGSTCWVLCRGLITEWDADGQPLRMIGVHHDITALKAREAELEQFSYVASHDLQEPLRKIMAFGQVLKEDFRDALPDEAKLHIDRMGNAAERMSTLLSDLLSYARVSRDASAHESVALDTVVDTVLDDFSSKIQETQATLEREPLPTVLGNTSLLYQLFANLIGNACKYQQPGTTPAIQVRCQREGNEYVIRIIDNGIGIDPKFAQEVFRPFRRLHGRSEYSGSGIGLAICRKVAEHHGWILTLDTEHTSGSCFVIRIPQEEHT